jgi:hypothetical protein
LMTNTQSPRSYTRNLSSLDLREMYWCELAMGLYFSSIQFMDFSNAFMCLYRR